MVYCFTCRDCGFQCELNSREVPGCYQCGGDLLRDWRREAVGVGAGVRVSRDGTDHERARLFLPSNDEFKGPDDPDGTKGMREWHDTHQPKESTGDRSLVPGNIERKSF